MACELKGRVVAKENVGWLKSKVNWHGCDMLIFAGLPSLAKTKLWRQEKQKEKTVNDIIII